MKAVYKLQFDCGRMGELKGVFVADTKDVSLLIDNKIEVYFGEALGKHSEVYGPIEESELKFVSSNADVIKVIEDHQLMNGYNPFEYPSINFNTEAIGFKGDDPIVQDIIDRLKLSN